MNKKLIILVAVLMLAGLIYINRDNLPQIEKKPEQITLQDSTANKYLIGIYIGIHLMKYIDYREGKGDTLSEFEIDKMCQDAIEGKNVFYIYRIPVDSTAVK